MSANAQPRMRPLATLPEAARTRVRGVLADIDDTLTTEGRLTAEAYAALARLCDAGFVIVPITGRPAGWCDHIARMWPVAAVVGENGAFYYRYDRGARRMERRYFKPEAERAADRKRLEQLKARILAEGPGCAVSADQAFREADLAIDFCEDVPRLPAEAVERIVTCFERAGARAKVSSIHVNGWFGDYDKLTMTRRLFQECWRADLDAVRGECVFVGDSPNDQPMFAFFPHSVGVANVAAFAAQMTRLPAYVTTREGGHGFAELAELLIG